MFQLTDQQKRLLLELQNGGYCPLMEGKRFVQTGSGMLVKEETLQALIRQKLVKQAEVAPPQHGAKKIKAWIFCPPDDPDAGQRETTFEKAMEARGAEWEKAIDAAVNKLVAVAQVAPDAETRRRQFKPIIVNLLKEVPR